MSFVEEIHSVLNTLKNTYSSINYDLLKIDEEEKNDKVNNTFLLKFLKNDENLYECKIITTIDNNGNFEKYELFNNKTLQTLIEFSNKNNGAYEKEQNKWYNTSQFTKLYKNLKVVFAYVELMENKNKK
jgi:hypothetical protein